MLAALPASTRARLAILGERLGIAVEQMPSSSQSGAVIKVAAELLLMAHGERTEAGAEQRIAMVRRKLELRSRGSAALLLFLLEHPDVTMTSLALARAIGIRATSHSVIKVYVHWLRVALLDRGLGMCVETRRRQGYVLPRAASLNIRQLLD